MLVKKILNNGHFWKSPIYEVKSKKTWSSLTKNFIQRNFEFSNFNFFSLKIHKWASFVQNFMFFWRVFLSEKWKSLKMSNFWLKNRCHFEGSPDQLDRFFSSFSRLILFKHILKTKNPSKTPKIWDFEKVVNWGCCFQKELPIVKSITILAAILEFRRHISSDKKLFFYEICPI